MRFSFLISLSVSILLSSFNSYAQQLDSLSFLQKSKKQNKIAFSSLGLFSTANIVGSSIGWATTEKESVEYSFHTTNVAWNAINLGIILPSYFINPFRKATTSKDVFATHRKLEKALLINAGFDVGYMLLGSWMIYESSYRDTKQASWEGAGKGILYNGMALFIYDVLFYACKNRLSNQYLKNKIQFSFYPTLDGSGLVAGLRFTL